MAALASNLDTALIYLFGASALVCAALMIVLRHPMQVAVALVSTMVLLSAIYGMLGVHYIAAFQVLIYVGAVMVFMVYVIMLLDVRDASFTRRFSHWLVPGLAGAVVFVGLLAWVFGQGRFAPAQGAATYGLSEFAVAFLNEYWLHFELTSVLLVAAVVAAMAVMRGAKRHG